MSVSSKVINAALVGSLATPLLLLTYSAGAEVALVLVAIIILMAGLGLVVPVFASVDEPYVGFVAGFSIFVHILLLAQFIPISVVALAIVSAAAAVGLACLCRSRRLATGYDLVTGVLLSFFTLAWCYDLTSRLRLFEQTGKLDFWSDIFIHIGTISQFGAHNAVGRGIFSMADVPYTLYHYVSFMPSALLVDVVGMSPLDAAVLVWIPLGVLVMVAGITALATAMGPHRIAPWIVLAALALFPIINGLILQNGLLSFAWLLDVAPGTPYSLGVASASLAMLVYWLKSKNSPALAVAFLLCGACILTRVNTFVWLAPTMALSTIFGITWLPKRWKIASAVIAFALLAIFLIFISKEQIQANYFQFLSAYFDVVHVQQKPTNYSDGYMFLTGLTGPYFAIVPGIIFLLFGTLGPLVPIFVIGSWICLAKRQCEAFDIIPFFLIAVAVTMFLLAPTGSNGDITEFRHRPGPLLVVVLAAWSVRFCLLIATPYIDRANQKTVRGISAATVAIAVGTMGLTISSARVPSMDWAERFYGLRLQPGLFEMATYLRQTTELRPSFVVAGQPVDARDIDDATTLGALSGIPPYVSRPQIFMLRQDSVGDESRRRMAVVKKLSEATSLIQLRDLMSSEQITYYVVTDPTKMNLDPARTQAMWSRDGYAVYGGR